MTNPVDGGDPFAELFSDSPASPAEITAVNTIVNEILDSAPHELVMDYYIMADSQYGAILSHSTHFESGNSNSTVGSAFFNFFGQSDNPLLSVVYDTNGDIADLSADGRKSTSEIVEAVEFIISKITDSMFGADKENEKRIFDRLLVYAQALDGKVDADTFINSMNFNMYDVMNDVLTEKNLVETKISKLSGTLASGTKVMVMGTEYSGTDYYADEQLLLWKLVEINKPNSETSQSLRIYRDGSVTYEHQNLSDEDSDDDEAEVNTREEIIKSGLFWPSTDEVELIIDQLLELSKLASAD